MLSSLLDDLSQIIDKNDVETNLMCLYADHLALDPAEKDDPTTALHLVTEAGIEEENQQLARQIQAQKVRNEAASKLLKMSSLSLQNCLDPLRGFVEQRSQDIIQVHREYLDELHAQRKTNLELALKNAELENILFRTSRNLGTVLNKSITYKDDSQSIDYLHAKSAIRRYSPS